MHGLAIVAQSFLGVPLGIADGLRAFGACSDKLNIGSLRSTEL
jgi:hypothetical protein